mmetsp:Transcript_49449/g.98828  ORF Transcript_49449/g.98828 Transcript_49449/m.98828 type:complete len:457 (-) Transcript_49449:129-1499(-)
MVPKLVALPFAVIFPVFFCLQVAVDVRMRALVPTGNAPVHKVISLASGPAPRTSPNTTRIAKNPDKSKKGVKDFDRPAVTRNYRKTSSMRHELIPRTEQEITYREKTFRERVEMSCGYQGLVEKFKSRSDHALPISCANFNEIQQEMGEMVGSSRKVTKGTWNGKCVAIKQLKKGMESASGLDMMEREASFLFAMRNSSRIMPLLGYCDGQQVFECFTPISFFDLEPRRRLEVAAEAAAAVAELHSAPSGPFVHRDLHRRQLMTDSNGKVYLQDFNEVQYVGPRRQHSGVCAPTGLGLAKNRTFSPEEMRSWLASGPESLHRALKRSVPEKDDFQESALDAKYEVFHLGWLLWNILTLTPAHFGVHWKESWRRVLNDDKWARTVPTIRKFLGWYPREVEEAVLACWHGDPSRRPSAEVVARRLQAVVEREKRELAARGDAAKEKRASHTDSGSARK